MGSVCSCIPIVDLGEDVDSPNHGGRRGFFRDLLNMYAAVFGRNRMQQVAPAHHDPHPPTTNVAAESAESDTNTPLPRSLPFDANSNSQQNGTIRRDEDGAAHFPSHKGLDPHSTGDHNGPEQATEANKTVKVGGKGDSTLHESWKLLFDQMEPVGPRPDEEEEDDCPICLEEYTPENPKMRLQCSHHYHLSCMYEWMERSESCPCCGKVMLFEEETD